MHDFHANIMLDLECTDATVPNPIIIEIAAVHFDINTGAELAHFHSAINFQSSVNHGHLSSEQGLKWLGANIPETLKTSMSTSVSLEQALFRFSSFVRRCCKKTKDRLKDEGCERKVHDSQPMIWGNGAVADNVWISSAYRSCNMEKPWKFYNDMCVRTFVRQCSLMTGRDFAREQAFEGTKHVALDDCRHQVAYLVKARNSLVPVRPKALASGTTSRSRVLNQKASATILKMLEEQDNSEHLQKQTESNDYSTAETIPLTTPKPLQKEPEELIKPAEAPIARPPSKNGLLTPSTSFSKPGEEEDFEEASFFNAAAIMYNTASSPQSKKKIGLLSPETSLSEKDCEDEAETCPTKHPMKQFQSGKNILPANSESPSKRSYSPDKPLTTDASTDQPPSPTIPRREFWFSR